MITNTSSISKKIITYLVIIFTISNIFLYAGFTYISKNAFYTLEKEKANIILENFSPMVATDIYLELKKPLNKLLTQILKNKSVKKVEIYKNNKLLLSKDKPYLNFDIKISKTLYLPNNNLKIGKMTLYYSTQNYINFLKQYNFWIAINIIFVLFIFLLMSIYINTLLKPLNILAKLIKKNKEGEFIKNIPFLDRKDEVGLLANAINSFQQKIEAYSKNLQEINKNIVKTNLDLQKKVQQEVEIIREKDKQLLQQSKLAQMGEMISMIAHQWRQPLAAITTTTSNLNFKIIMDEINKDELQNEITNIENYVQHLSKTIDDFRNFFKENKNKESKSIDFLVENSISLVKNLIANKNITIIKEFKCKEQIHTYTNEISQVLLNLISNAKDAFLENSTKDPTITISTYCKDGYAYISCHDNAGGISEDILDDIFNPYFSTKKEKDGTGLGLYMSKTIVEDHCGGKLTVENKNNGALFTIKLPKGV